MIKTVVVIGDEPDPFAVMRAVIEATRPHHVSLLDLAIRYPKEKLTLDESLVVAEQLGARRLVLKDQVSALRD